MHRSLLVFLLLTLACLTLTPARASYNRWAVLTSGTEEEREFSALLLAELTKVPDLEMVEREELEQLAGEQALSSALSAEGSASRLKLGKLLRADALVLTKLTGDQDARELQIIVSECTCGARLRVEQLPWKAESLPALVDHTKTLVFELRKRFADGIKQVYGVPDFISKSLSREYDPLQARYAQTLLNALSLQPGVAVLETSEARILSRELAVAEGPAMQRLMPVFVAGEFRVEPNPDTNATITLTVTLSDGVKVLARQESGVLPLPDAPKWLATKVALEILAHAGKATPLPLDAQIMALVMQGRAFLALGSVEDALQAYETVLLLDPNSYFIRMITYKEYLRIAQYDADCTFSTMPNASHEQKEAFLTHRIEAYLAAMDHMEYLIRNHQPPGGILSVVVLFEPLGDATAAMRIIKFNDYPGLKQRLPMLREKIRRFIDEVAPLALPAPDGSRDAVAACDHWQKNVIGITLSLACIGQSQPAEEDQRLLQHIILDYVPDSTDLMLNWLIPQGISDEEFALYCDNYRHSTKHNVRILGDYLILERRFNRLWLKVNHNKLDWKDYANEVNGMMKDADQLIALFAQMPDLNPPLMPKEQYNSLIILKTLRESMEGAQKLASAKDVPPPPAIDPFGALKFEPIALKVVGGTPDEKVAGWPAVRFYPFSLEVEIVGSNSCLYRHDRPGELRKIVSTEGMPAGTTFSDLVWDGDLIWVGVYPNALWAITPEGKIVARIAKAQGLPDANKMLLHAISKGRILVTGSFGIDERGWCAIVEWKGEPNIAPAVNVFLEAKHASAPGMTVSSARDKIVFDPASCFTPGWIQQVTAPNGQEAVLIGRFNKNAYQFGGGLLTGEAQLRPLMINLKSLQVDVPDLIVTRHPFNTDPYRSFCSHDKLLFGFDINYKRSHECLTVLRLDQVDNEKHILREYSVNSMPTKDERGIVKTGSPVVIPLGRTPPILLPFTDGWVYIPGYQWWRLNPDTLAAQKLTRANLPDSYTFPLGDIGISNHFGLIAWDKGKICRIVIDETKIP